ncbi:MAG: T9SS type A sorting domain-containing protein [Bacteroidota bacterium]|nr:T9SS type A sorting domain-containing protein [Bacteroidota bacterium]
MKNISKFTISLFSFVIVALLSLSLVQEAAASHFRYGHLTFTRDTANCNIVDFTLTNAFRRGYAPNNDVGDVFNETIGATRLIFGDGTQTPTLRYRVIAVDAVANFLIARALQPGNDAKETITKDYSGVTAPGPYLAEINSGSRTAVEINHPSAGYRVSTLIHRDNCNNSPISSLPVILNLIQSPNTQFQVPGLNTDPSKVLRWRYATVAEMGVTGSNPFPAFGGAASIDPNTGVVTWNTSAGIVGGLYSTQVIIEQRDLTTDTVKTRVAVDWLSRILPPCPDTSQPVFVLPTTPTCGFTDTSNVGVPISFTVQATDNFSGPITLNATGLPPGATTNPVLPTTGNPVSTVFNWTPTQSGGQLFSFTATDSCGNQAICIISYDIPFPVELSSFVSIVSNNDITLNWTTATETNNSRFEIERATGNSQEWTNAGTVQGNGNSTLSNSYSFTDRGLNIGTYNYRIKQIDFNGNFEYHNLTSEVVIGVPSRFALSQNYPNPFNPSTKIDFELPNDGNVYISVYDNSGKQVSTLTSGFKNAGYYTIQFNAANLSSGVYYYKIQFASGDQSFEKVMKMALLK